MSLKITLLGVLIGGLFLTPCLRADASAYAAILKQRDGVLSRIVSETEARQKVGLATDEAVYAAQLALLSFRRDTAPTIGEKLRHQTKVVALEEWRLGLLKAREQTGTVQTLDVLRATDAMLAAKQVQEELQAGVPNGH